MTNQTKDNKPKMPAELNLPDISWFSTLALQYIEEVVIITDREGVIQYVNPAFEKGCGYTPAEALGQRPSILRSGHQPDSFYKSLWETILDGKAWRGLFMNRRKDGSLFHEKSVIYPIHNQSGDITHFIAIKRDLTKQKQAEAQLRQNQRLEAIGHLSSGIAHEINTPMQFIGDSVHFLQEATTDLLNLQEHYVLACKTMERGEDVQPLLETINEIRDDIDVDFLEKEMPAAIERTLSGVHRVSTIIKAMKEFAHPGSKQLVLEDPTKALRTSLIVARNEYKYVATIEENLGILTPVPCLLSEMNQVFLNLLINAADAIYEKLGDSGLQGVISLASWEDDTWVYFSISDTGSGMTPDVEARIFEPFYTTKPKGKGSGQGMPICREIVEEKHSGKILVESEPDEGSTFTILLPKHNPNFNPDEAMYDETKNTFRR